MTADEIIDGVLTREGGWRDAVQRPDGTWDPDTNHGITLDTYRHYVDPLGTSADLRRMLPATAAQIFQTRYIDEPGFTAANIPYEPLRAQLIDFGINSGQATAIRWLQRVLGLPATEVDGVFGPITRMALTQVTSAVSPLRGQVRWRILNDALVAARSYMVDRAVDQGRMRKADEEGVESRALSFFLARP